MLIILNCQVSLRLPKKNLKFEKEGPGRLKFLLKWVLTCIAQPTIEQYFWNPVKLEKSKELPYPNLMLSSKYLRYVCILIKFRDHDNFTFPILRDKCWKYLPG